MESQNSSSSPSLSSGSETQTVTLAELREACALLLAEPGLLEGLERAERHHQPLIVHVEGYRHSTDTMLALLRYAYACGVTVMLIPRPVITILEPADGKRAGEAQAI